MVNGNNQGNGELEKLKKEVAQLKKRRAGKVPSPKRLSARRLLKKAKRPTLVISVPQQVRGQPMPQFRSMVQQERRNLFFRF